MCRCAPANVWITSSTCTANVSQALAWKQTPCHLSILDLCMPCLCNTHCAASVGGAVRAVGGDDGSAADDDVQLCLRLLCGGRALCTYPIISLAVAKLQGAVGGHMVQLFLVMRRSSGSTSLLLQPQQLAVNGGGTATSAATAAGAHNSAQSTASCTCAGQCLCFLRKVCVQFLRTLHFHARLVRQMTSGIMASASAAATVNALPP